MHAKILVVDTIMRGIRIETWFSELEQQALVLNVYLYRCTTPSVETEWAF